MDQIRWRAELISWLLYPENPTDEYRQALKELGRKEWEETWLSFPNYAFGLMNEFFSANRINFTGYVREDGALVVTLSDELLADADTTLKLHLAVEDSSQISISCHRLGFCPYPRASRFGATASLH